VEVAERRTQNGGNADSRKMVSLKRQRRSWNRRRSLASVADVEAAHHQRNVNTTNRTPISGANEQWSQKERKKERCRVRGL